METIYRVERRRDGRKYQVNEYTVYDDGHSRFVQTREETITQYAAHTMCDAYNLEQDNGSQSNPSGDAS